MRFEVTRSSQSPWDENSPHPGATRANEGQPHAIWAIEIATLEELMAFAAEAGELVLKPGEDGLPELEIYDTYRE